MRDFSTSFVCRFVNCTQRQKYFTLLRNGDLISFYKLYSKTQGYILWPHMKIFAPLEIFLILPCFFAILNAYETGKHNKYSFPLFTSYFPFFSFSPLPTYSLKILPCSLIFFSQKFSPRI